MIRIEPSDGPADVNAKVRKKGNGALLELIGSAEALTRTGPKRKKVADDHFKPKAKHPRLAYEWSNFRLAAHQVKTDKGDYEDVLDPFEVEDGWFVLDLLTFKVDAAEGLDEATRKAVFATRARLRVNEPTYCERRARYHDIYHGLTIAPDNPDEPLPLKWLLRHCPFVARELHRPKRLRPEDTITNVPLNQSAKESPDGPT